MCQEKGVRRTLTFSCLHNTYGLIFFQILLILQIIVIGIWIWICPGGRIRAFGAEEV